MDILTTIPKKHYNFFIKIVNEDKAAAISHELSSRLVELARKTCEELDYVGVWENLDREGMESDAEIKTARLNKVLEKALKGVELRARFSVRTAPNLSLPELSAKIIIANAPNGLKFEDVNGDPTVGWVSIKNKLPTTTASHPEGIHPARVLIAGLGVGQSSAVEGARYVSMDALYGPVEEQGETFYTRNFEGDPLLVSLDVHYWRLPPHGPVIPYTPLNGYSLREAGEKKATLQAWLVGEFTRAQEAAEECDGGSYSEDTADAMASGTLRNFIAEAERIHVTLSEHFKNSIAHNLSSVLQGEGDWEIAMMGLDWSFLIH